MRLIDRVILKRVVLVSRFEFAKEMVRSARTITVFVVKFWDFNNVYGHSLSGAAA